ncbi:MAG: hypothetical protein H7Y07_12360 [Pyrinomonadaceae bacterium]|nr:hypothetical protein [Sphingobacteriaceae bacterium]
MKQKNRLFYSSKIQMLNEVVAQRPLDEKVGKKSRKEICFPYTGKTPWPAFLFGPTRPGFSPIPIAKHVKLKTYSAWL